MSWKRWLKWSSLTGTLVLLLAIGLANCVSFSMKREDADAQLQASGAVAEHGYLRSEKHRVHYAAVGDPGRPMLLFVHGSPGSWDAFIGFLADARMRERYYLVSVDRPGFGESGRGVHEPSLVEQARAIAPVFEKNQSGQAAILVGHSFGGPVVAQLALDYPNQVGGLVLVAASIAPEQEKTKWYQIPADWQLLSWMVPKDLRTTNREILPLKGELERLLPRWSDLHQPTILIQGEQDGLVPPENADFAERVLKSAPLEIRRIGDLGHFIPWQRPDLIVTAADDLLLKLGGSLQKPSGDAAAESR